MWSNRPSSAIITACLLLVILAGSTGQSSGGSPGAALQGRRRGYGGTHAEAGDSSTPIEGKCRCGAGEGRDLMRGMKVEIVHPRDGHVVGPSSMESGQGGAGDGGKEGRRRCRGGGEGKVSNLEGDSTSGEERLLVEIALSAPTESEHAPLSLPSPRDDSTSRSRLLQAGCLTVIVDGERWGPPIPTRRPSQPSPGLTAALARYEAAEFGSGVSASAFAEWTSMADAEASDDCPGMGRGRERSRVHVEERRAGTVWRDPAAGPEDVAYVSLSLGGVRPGRRTVEVVVDDGGGQEGAGQGDGMGGSRAKIQVEFAGEEYMARLPEGMAKIWIGGGESIVDADDPGPSSMRGHTVSSSSGRSRSSMERGSRSKISICVLAGFPKGARSSLANAIESWAVSGLLRIAYEVVIMFQQVEDSDEAWAQNLIARKMAEAREEDGEGGDGGLGGEVVEVPDVRVMGVHGANVGIGRGISELVLQARGEYVLFLEDDWVLPRRGEEWGPLLDGALELLGGGGGGWGGADVVRLKSDEYTPQTQSQVVGVDHLHVVLDCSRFAPPHATHFHCACLDEYMQPRGHGSWKGAPEELFHDLEICWRGTGDASDLKYFCMPSRSCKYTNTPTMFRRSWFLSSILPISRVDPGITVDKHFLEVNVNESWPMRPIVVAVPNSGLFAHVELEDKEDDPP